jgi:integrase
MRILSPNSVTILDGNIVLTRRVGSSKWQARYKIGNRWIRITTGEKDLKEAKEVASDRYLDAKYRVRHGVPVQTKRFKDVAKLSIARMQTAIDGGHGKKTYRDYVQATNKYLIPYFGSHHVDKITAADMQKFAEWRVEQMGKQPKASTLSNHNGALNRIFDEALLHNYVTKAQIPDLENKGLKSDRRPAFSRDEYLKLSRAMRHWVKKGREGKSRGMRLLLRDYVLILANTGMRHGTEAQNLRWNHISVIEQDGYKYIAMWVKGKTKARELVAKHSGVIRYLDRIRSRCEDIAHLSMEDLLRSGCDLPVFRLPDGMVTDNLRQTFKAFLKDHGLLKDPVTGQDRTLYSLRHTYATFQIVYRGIDLHLLATQMGTSIAMIERHYSHLKPRMNAHKLAGRFWASKKQADYEPE